MLSFLTKGLVPTCMYICICTWYFFNKSPPNAPCAPRAPPHPHPPTHVGSSLRGVQHQENNVYMISLDSSSGTNAEKELTGPYLINMHNIICMERGRDMDAGGNISWRTTVLHPARNCHCGGSAIVALCILQPTHGRAMLWHDYNSGLSVILLLTSLRYDAQARNYPSVHWPGRRVRWHGPHFRQSAKEARSISWGVGVWLGGHQYWSPSLEGG